MRLPLPLLAEFFGEQQKMFESPLFQRMIAEKCHQAIQKDLKARFGSVPRDVTRLLRDIRDEEKLTDLNVLAAQ